MNDGTSASDHRSTFECRSAPSRCLPATPAQSCSPSTPTMATSSRCSRPAIACRCVIPRDGAGAGATAGSSLTFQPAPMSSSVRRLATYDSSVGWVSCACTQRAATSRWATRRRVDVTTASGEFSCGEIDGDATVSSVSGDCTMRRVGGRLDATVHVRRRANRSVRRGSRDRLDQWRCAHRSMRRPDIAIRSISGDVRVGLPTGIRVEAEISTLSGRATLPEPVPAADAGDRRAVRLQLKSVSGDIRVERTS